jgi:hypothetical protein
MDYELKKGRVLITLSTKRRVAPQSELLGGPLTYVHTLGTGSTVSK